MTGEFYSDIYRSSTPAVIQGFFFPREERRQHDETEEGAFFTLLWAQRKFAQSTPDPVYAFMALKKIGLPLEDFKIYTELISLVHALGSRNGPVRDFALSHLITLEALDKSFAKTKDYVGALVAFTKHNHRSVRYRAVLGLKEKPDRRVYDALVPLITDDEAVYRFPSIIMGMGTTRTIRQAEIEVLKQQRDHFEQNLISLLSNEDYKVRLAAIDIFNGSKKQRVRSMLKKLEKEDEYSDVREAAGKALEQNKWSRRENQDISPYPIYPDS